MIDLDGDGFDDVLTAYYTDNKITWYKNTGLLYDPYNTDSLPGFKAHDIVTNVLGAYDVYAIDIDGDSDIDVLSTTIGISENLI